MAYQLEINLSLNTHK